MTRYTLTTGPPAAVFGWKLGSWGLKGPPRVRGDDGKGG